MAMTTIDSSETMETAQKRSAKARSKYHPGEIVRSLYDWVIHWADTPHAQIALFLIAFAESSFFPIPPDVLLIAMGVGAPKRALRFAAICLAGSVLGGVAGYAIGFGLWSAVDQHFFTYVPGFTPEKFAKVSALFNDNAFWAVFTAGFTPIPYKIFTISAGAAQIDVLPFVLASICSRGLRFFLVGGALRLFGASVKRLIDKYFDLITIAFTVLLIGGFYVVKVAFK